MSEEGGVRDGVYVVPPGVSKQPLDGALRGIFPGISWGDARKLASTGKVRVNGDLAQDNRRPVSSGDEITVQRTAPRPATRQRLGREVIAHIDGHVVVVRKPAGISTVPFDERETDTLDQLVRSLLSRERRARGGGAQGWVGVVHRLDKETSGLLVFALTLAAKKHLAQQFRDHTTHRRYSALVHGHLDAPRTFRSRLVADRGDGIRGSTEAPGQGQMAVTHVTPLRHLEGATLVDCRLETGRTHQIRIHLSEAGFPLVGERVYTRRHGGPLLPAPRLMLHARELGFTHPNTNEEVRLEEPLPSDMATVLERLSHVRRLPGACSPHAPPLRQAPGARPSPRRALAPRGADRVLPAAPRRLRAAPQGRGPLRAHDVADASAGGDAQRRSAMPPL